MFLLAFFAMTGCKKEGGSASKYYVKFKANGVQQELRSKIGGNRMGGGLIGPLDYYTGVNTWRFKMAGYGAEPEAYPCLQIDIRSAEPIVINKIYKTVTENIPLNGSTEIFYSEKVDTYERFINYGFSENVQVTITEMGDKSIRGIFSGTLRNADGTKQCVLTEGEFYVERL